MRKTMANNIEKEPLMISVDQLRQKLNCGYKTAVVIGTEANARVYVGRRVWYYLPKIDAYLKNMAV